MPWYMMNIIFSFIKNNDSVSFIAMMLWHIHKTITKGALSRSHSLIFHVKSQNTKAVTMKFWICFSPFSPRLVSIFDRKHSIFIYKIIFQLHPLHTPRWKYIQLFCCHGVRTVMHFSGRANNKNWCWQIYWKKSASVAKWTVSYDTDFIGYMEEKLAYDWSLMVRWT